jgi:hypothetical protein
VVRVFSIYGVAVTGAGGSPVPCLLREGRPEPPSLLDAMRNSLVESSIMACHRDGVPLQVESMKVAPELPLLGKRLKPAK